MIKQRNLDNSLVQWIMTQTGLGPGIGEIEYVAPATSTTSQYRTQLESMNVSSGSISTTLATAENRLTANRNDIVLAMPGSYTQTTELAWDKDHTHLLGLGGPNNEGDHSLSGVTFYTSTTQVGETMDITGDRCIFQNFLIGNGGDHGDNVGAVNVDGWGNYFKNIKFIGIIADNQVSDVECGSLLIDRLGHFPIFEDCVIGQNGWNNRTQANQGHLRFVGTTAPAPQNGLFRRCTFLSRSDTATCAMVAIPANTSLDRLWTFDKCIFSNFGLNNANNLNQVFYDASGDAWNILLTDCAATGIDEWQDADRGANWIGATMPIVGLGGGLVRNPTAVTGN